MIDYLEGEIIHLSASKIVIKSGQVGYGLECPLSLLSSIESVGQNVKIWVHTYVRENIFKLYGFQSLQEKELFLLFTSINKVGPKVALAILSTLSLNQIFLALHDEESQVFAGVPGIGQKTAERILVELKNRYEKLRFIQGSYGNSISNSGKTSALSDETNSKNTSERGHGAGKTLFDDPYDNQMGDNSLNFYEIKEALAGLGFKVKNHEKLIKSTLKQHQNASQIPLGKLLKEIISAIHVSDTQNQNKNKNQSKKTKSLDTIF